MEKGVLSDEERVSRRLTMERDQFVVLNNILYRIGGRKKDKLQVCVPQSKREGGMVETGSWRKLCRAFLSKRNIFHVGSEVLVGW